MCVMSMVMDHYTDKWRDPWQIPPHVQPYAVPSNYPLMKPAISPEEVAEFRKLLDRAREYDKKKNQPDCELQEKKDAIKKLAEAAGVKIDFLD